MAKRKAARSTARKAARQVAKKAKKVARKPARAVARKKAAPKKAARKAPARKPAARKPAGKPVAAKKAAPKKAAPKKAAPKKAAKKVARKAAPKTAARKVVAKKVAAKAAAPIARKAPALNRARRTLAEEDIIQSPPSSLDLDRTASAARSGRREMKERYDQHTETSPELTGGDVDADWESAYSVGDEAPGGDNPTPDQDIVDDIGKALGVVYEDSEELKGEKKISDRDEHRWELDPASAEDFPEHDED